MRGEDFGPLDPPTWLLVVLGGFGCLTLAMGLLALALILAPTTGAWPYWVCVGLLALGLLIGFPVALVFGTRVARRFRFDDEAVTFRSWRGARRLPWNQVRNARLVRGDADSGSRVDLRLDDGGPRSLRIPLGRFARQRALYLAIAERLDTEVVATGLDPRELADDAAPDA